MDSNGKPLLAGIEAGGTKYVCAVGFDPENPVDELRFEIRYEDENGEEVNLPPSEVLAKTVEYFEQKVEEFGPIGAMGIGTFGPAQIDREAENFGSILPTPKPGWAGFNVVQAIQSGLGGDFPIDFETDVNGAAIGEACYGAAVGIDNVCYVTVGTGIGGGFLHNGTPLHGRMHPEAGHLLIPNFEADFDSPNPGNVCPFHDNCWEGFASGKSMDERWGINAKNLPSDSPAWDLEAKYLAHGCVSLTAAWSPDIIIIGGGVIQQESLIGKVRNEFEKLSGGYWGGLPSMEDYIVTPRLDQMAGIVGSLEMARRLVG